MWHFDKISVRSSKVFRQWIYDKFTQMLICNCTMSLIYLIYDKYMHMLLCYCTMSLIYLIYDEYIQMLLPFHFLGIWNIQHFQSYHSWSIQQLTLNLSLILPFQHFFMFNILPFLNFFCRSFFIHPPKHLLSFILNSSLIHSF